MKRSLKFIVLSLVLALFFSCEDQGSKMRSSGGVYEVFVVSPDSVWNGELGDTLRSILLKPVMMINQKEPIFDMANIPASAYKGLILQHRNILNVKVDSQYAEPQLLAEYDKYAQPQIVVSLLAPNQEVAASYISDNRNDLVTILELAERQRALAFHKKFNELVIQNQIESKFGFTMSVPRGYKLRNELQDFLWISNEMPVASQGVVIYSYPFTGKSDFTVENLVKRRNEFMKNIPSEAKDSYMQTADIEPIVKHSKIGGRYWAQTNGLWNVHNDFMGGPFVSYSTVDALTNMVICIDMYVYSPKNHKRNYLRGLEHLVYSVRFPQIDKTSGQ